MTLPLLSGIQSYSYDMYKTATRSAGLRFGRDAPIINYYECLVIGMLIKIIEVLVLFWASESDLSGPCYNRCDIFSFC